MKMAFSSLAKPLSRRSASECVHPSSLSQALPSSGLRLKNSGPSGSVGSRCFPMGGSVAGRPETLPPMGKHRDPTDPDGPEFFNRRPLDGSAWLSELGWTHSDADRRLRGFANELKAIFIEIHERDSDPQAAADL